MGSEGGGLREDFESLRIPAGGFGHRQHVRLAWIYLKEFGLAGGLTRLTTGLRAFTQALGQPEKFHVTLTWAFAVLIQERMAQLPTDHDWETFCAVHGDVLADGRALLLRYYRPSTLDSERARQAFVLPDRAFAAE